ncbi:MAG: hypothetical protein JW904_13500 [Spirochaetales bacterium]|nr:hypothetical protein [Spirochaetales bacterium]
MKTIQSKGAAIKLFLPVKKLKIPVFLLFTNLQKMTMIIRTGSACKTHAFMGYNREGS